MPKTAQRSKLKLKAFVPSEHDEQVAVVDALRMLGARFFSVPNYRPLDGSWGTWNYLIAEGFAVGCPDLVICEMRGGYGAAFLEMKRRANGTVSPAQIDWHNALRERGYFVAVPRGATEGIQIAVNYLGGKYMRSQ